MEMKSRLSWTADVARMGRKECIQIFCVKPLGKRSLDKLHYDQEAVSLISEI
jgi:hypothetical protein